MSGVAGFMYHEVTDDPESTGLQRRSALPYAVAPAVFQRHLDAFARAPGAPALVTAMDLDRPAAPPRLLLTFDDGGRSARAAADALAQRGWRGHFFIVTARIGERTFLSPADILALRDEGHVIGSHSHTHPDVFRALSRAAMVDEWRVSRDILGALLGAPCTVASVPGGEISPDVLRSADAAGLRHLFTSEPTLRPERVGSCWVLGRFCVRAGTTARRVHRLASGRGWVLARAQRRLKVLARRGLGPLYDRMAERHRREVPPGALADRRP